MNGKRLRVLIIGENAVRAAILEEGLREAGPLDVHHVRDMMRLEPRITAIDPDVIIMDLEDPGRDTLERMLEISRLAKRPTVMFVDRSDAAAARAAIDAGVSAYVVDGLRKERVKSILDVAVSRFRAFDRLRTELTQARSALEERKIIERAKAILMRQKRLSEPDAYLLLRRTAMSQSRKIADLARAIVAAADLLDSGGGG